MRNFPDLFPNFSAAVMELNKLIRFRNFIFLSFPPNLEKKMTSNSVLVGFG